MTQNAVISVTRRGLIGMLSAGIGAAIVRPGILMPIKPKLVPTVGGGFALFSSHENGKIEFRIRGTDQYGNSVTESIWVDPTDPSSSVSKKSFRSFSSILLNDASSIILNEAVHS